MDFRAHLEYLFGFKYQPPEQQTIKVGDWVHWNAWDCYTGKRIEGAIAGFGCHTVNVTYRVLGQSRTFCVPIEFVFPAERPKASETDPAFVRGEAVIVNGVVGIGFVCRIDHDRIYVGFEGDGAPSWKWFSASEVRLADNPSHYPKPESLTVKALTEAKRCLGNVWTRPNTVCDYERHLKCLGLIDKALAAEGAAK